MPVTVPEIVAEIEERGRSGFNPAARQFTKGTREQTILRYDLKVYQKETDTLRKKFPRHPEVVYSDADLCLLHLDIDEDRALVFGDRDETVPAWWLIGNDDFRDSGLALMEFPIDEPDQPREWTRTTILEVFDLDGWQTPSTEQVATMDVDHTYRLDSRLAMKRYDPDDWIDRHQQSGIPIDWENLEQQRATTATRLPPHLLVFEDAGDLVHTFDPLRERQLPSYFQETAYIPDGADMYIIAEHSHNRTVTLQEGVYEFRQIARCRRHSARYPSSPIDSKNSAKTFM